MPRVTGRLIPEDPNDEWPDLPEGDEPGDDFPDPGDSGPGTSPEGTYSERVYSAPRTALDAVIPMVYGTQQVPGYCAAWNTSATYLDMAFVFCFGEQASLGTIMVNDEAISGLAWVTSYNTFLGSGTGTRPTYMSFVDSADWTTLMGFACITMRVSIKVANCPGSFQVTAVPTGRKFASFQSPYTVSNHTNLAEVAYDILTADAWKGLSSPAGTEAGGTWELFADHCDEVMGDASKRYTFNGVISERDPDAALKNVLATGFAGTYFSSDGKYQIWSEAPPPAITGTWSAAGTTVTEDASSGAATTDLEAGDIVYVGTTPCIVSSVTNDDTFVVDRSVTETSVKTRKTSGVYLKIDNWTRLPSGREIETGTIPDEVVVRYTLANYWGAVTYPTSPSQDRRIEVTVEACSNHSMARRISETKKNLMSLQPFLWKGVADAAAAGLEPGDVFFFDDGVLTFQAAKVRPPVEHLRDGNVSLGFQSYSIETVSDSTATDPVIPTQPTSYVSDDPPHFGAINSVTVGGTAYNFFRWDGSDAYVGDDLVVQVLDGVSIRLPNDVALLGLKYVTGTVQMLKVNASDELELGDGTVPIYFNGTAFTLKHDAYLRGRNYADTGYLNLLKITNSGSPSYLDIAQLGDASLSQISVDSTLVLADGKILYIMCGTTAVTGIRQDQTNQWLTMGSTTYPVKFTGGGLLPNDKYLQGAMSGDTGTFYNLIGLNTSGAVVVGHSLSPLNLWGMSTRPLYKGGELALLSDVGGSGVDNFIDLTDTDPTSYTGAAGQLVRVNSTPDGLEFASANGIDATAVHDNVAAEINALGAVTPAAADVVLFEDSSDSFNKAKATFSSFPHLLKSGGLMTGDLSLNNNVAIAGWNAAHTASYNLILVNASNQIRFGSSSAVVYLDGSTLTLGGTLTVSNGATFSSGVTFSSTVGITGALTLTGNLQSSGSVVTVNDNLALASTYGYQITDGSAQTVVAKTSAQTSIDFGNASYPARAPGGFRLPNNTALQAARTASTSTYYDLIKIDSTNYVAVGNTSCATLIYSSAGVYVGGSDFYFQGSGSVWLEGSGSNGMDLVLWNDKKLYCRNSSGTSIQCVTVDSSNNRIFGWTTGTTWVEGATLKMYGAGYSGTAGPPSTTQWPTAGSWGIHVDTDGSVYLAYNHGGSMKYVTLDNT